MTVRNANSAVTGAEFQRITTGRPLFQEVVKQIEAKVMNGELQPGEMLPPERVMAEQFGVSRTVIREAVKALELLQLVEVQHGRGVMIAKPTAQGVAESLIHYMKIDGSPIWALHELRSILEVEIAGLAAERATEADLARLTELLNEMRRKVDTPMDYIEVDLRFHRALTEASHNPLFPLVLEPVATLMRESRLIGVQAANAPRRSIQSHERIVEAIRQRDAAQARRVMREHFDKVAAFIQEGEAHGDSERGRAVQTRK